MALPVCVVLDYALMKSQIGLYKTELIKPPKPWHGLADVELATAEWGDWFNSDRRHPAPRARDQLLRSAPAPTGGWNQRIEPPPTPERFTQ